MLAITLGGHTVDATPPLLHASADEQLRALGRELPGFGGLYLDGAGVPHVYLVDPARQAGTAAKALGRRVGVVRGDFTFEQLLRTRDRMRSLLSLPGVVFLDADESRNRVVLGVDSSSPTAVAERTRVLRSLAALGSARAQVVLVDTAPVTPLAGLRNKFRPAAGGLQISWAPSGPAAVCTLGFNAVRGAQLGFVVNSHCTGRYGEPDGIRFVQSVRPDEIGGESHDPPFFTTSPCPLQRRCRYSDAAFAAYDDAALGSLGKIARPTFAAQEIGSLRVDPTSQRFTVFGRIDTPLVGDVAHKIGRTTGWTYGPVVQSCVDTNLLKGDITFLCQSHVRAGADSGDSGSPVFYRIGGGHRVRLAGILWGRRVTEFGQVFIFSPLPNVERELGALVVR